MTDAASALARTDQLEQLVMATSAAFAPAFGASATAVRAVAENAPSFASVLAATPTPNATLTSATVAYPAATSQPSASATLPAEAFPTVSYLAPAAAAPSAASAGGDAAGYLPLIQQAAARYGIDPSLLYGVIRQESAFNPNAVSSAGAEGLAQIMPENFASLDITNAFDPVQSVDGGAKMLAENLRTFGGNQSEALAAYNAGVGAVQRYGGVPPYPETQNYVQQVLGYAAQYPGAGAPAAYPTQYAGVTGAALAAQALPTATAGANTPIDPSAGQVPALSYATVEDTT